MKQVNHVALLAALTLPRAGIAQAAPPAVHVLSSLVDVTATRRPVWNGIADPGRTVILSLDGRPLGRATVDARGSWGFVTPADLSMGSHTVSVHIDGDDVRGDATVRRDFQVGTCSASAQCDGASPVCDVDLGRCRACDSDRECSPDHPVCSVRADTRGMCLSRPPEITSPTSGYAVLADEVVVRGHTTANAAVSVLVDGRDVLRAVSDARGDFCGTLPELTRAWHEVAAAQVEAGFVGSAGEGRRVLAVGCTEASHCARAERCDTARFVCVPR